MSKTSRGYKWVALISSISLILSFGIIAGLLFALKTSEKKLNKLGDLMEQMSDSRIEYDMTVEQTIPVTTNATITEDVNVGIDLTVIHEIPFQAEIPVTEKMMIPIRLGVSQTIYVDTLISITEDVLIQVDDTIPLDQKIQAMGVNMKAKAQIPLKQDLKVGFDEKLHMQAHIPIDMNIIDSMPLDLNMKIPVNIMVPVRIPLKTTAKISFIETLPFQADIPIKLDVPVNIPLNETAMGDYLKKVSKGMKELTKP